MEAAFLSQLVAVESAPANLESMPLRPARSVTKTYPAVPQRDTASIELERISRPATHTGTGTATPVTPGFRSGFTTPNELESSRAASPVMGHDDGVEALQNMWDPYMNRFRLLSACLMNFMDGLSDSASGPLIPYMEKYYGIGYAVVSLIFVGQAVGFITGAACIDPLRERLGRARALALAQIFMVGGYVIIACTAPFAAIVCAFFLIGLGMSINLALGNIFCGSLTNSTTALGAMHGSYGIGGITGPLIATAFVTVSNMVWSRYYLVTLGLAALNGFFALWTYWHYEKEHQNAAPAHQLRTSSEQAPAASKIAGIMKAFKSRVVLLGALFIFAYQGAEVSISGWVISFLEETRNGDPSSVGYVTSGFWAGITLGRFVLSIPAHKIGEKVFVYGVVVGAAVFELLVWLVPNVIGDAVSVSIVGLLLGPVYPCAAAIFMRTMSRAEKLSGMGVISAFGSSGGAAAPFTTGILAQAAGTFVLHPIAIGLFGVMLMCWYGLPSTRKRRE
ncbi:Bypass of stop codon protein 6 [Cytospora mali]|uniref:Bypass of stop codon protein 6 n=1 Tax=Cytospora mali TaxID=578113 RepID=A0A194VVX7_CYTMA|nr:Bypass of stop codon protein 6 [Valsa mali]